MTTTKTFLPLMLAALLFSLPAFALAAPEGNFDEDTLTAASGKTHSLTGTADDVKTIRVQIKNEKGKSMFRSKVIKVRDGEWKVRVSKKLPQGVYDLILTGKDKTKYEELATETLTVGSSSRSDKDGELSVSMLPLLMGGYGTPGASVAVAYVKVSNPTKATTTIKGFTLAENGTASDSIVTGFSTSDDKGGSRTTTANIFRNGTAFVPLTTTIAPGQIRIFTIKANLASFSTGSFAKQLRIDVASVDSDEAVIKGVFPLRGTTWTLLY